MHVLYPLRASDANKEHFIKVLDLTALTESDLTILVVFSPDVDVEEGVEGQLLDWFEGYLKVRDGASSHPTPPNFKKVRRVGDFSEELCLFFQSEEVDLLVISHQEMDKYSMAHFKNGRPCLLPLFP